MEEWQKELQKNTMKKEIAKQKNNMIRRMAKRYMTKKWEKRISKIGKKE